MRKLSELAEIVGGKVIGEDDMMIVGVGSVKDGALAGTITFAESEELHRAAEKTDAAAVIVSKEISHSSKVLLQVDNPRLAYAKIAHEFMPKPLMTGEINPSSMVHPDATVGKDVSIHPYAVIDKNAKIGDRSTIGPGVYVGQGVVIGSDCEIHANVVIEYDSIIGDRVIIHAGSVLGSDGFGFVTTKDGHFKLPQVGNVIIEDDVEIGANVTIDRGAIDSTVVGKGSKLDNLVHLAHNVTTGEECLIIAQSGIAGSTKLGRRVTLAGQSGIFGHLRVGDNVKLAARGVITNDVENDAFLSGFPAIEHNKNFRIKASLRKVPNLMKRIKELENKLAILEQKAKD